VITKHIGVFVPNKLKDVPKKKKLDNLPFYVTKGYMQISTMEKPLVEEASCGNHNS